MNHFDYDQIIKQYLEIKKKLQFYKELSETDMAVLSAKLLEVESNIPVDLFYKMKAGQDFIRYHFVGTDLIIDSISNSQRSMKNKIKLIIKHKLGNQYVPMSLLGKQAIIFLTLMQLKFDDFRKDAIGGININNELDGYVKNLSYNLGVDYSIIDNSDIENLKRKLQQVDLGQLIERPLNNLVRLSIAPNRIIFESAAREKFQVITSNAINRFNEEFHMSL